MILLLTMLPSGSSLSIHARQFNTADRLKKCCKVVAVHPCAAQLVDVEQRIY
jgi:hypothetical protein